MAKEIKQLAGSNILEMQFQNKNKQEIRVTRWKNAPNQVEFTINDFSSPKRTKCFGFVLEDKELQEFISFLTKEAHN